MIVTIIILIISFLLEAIIPCLFKNTILFFTLASMILLYGINKNKKNYFITIFIMGILFDLLYKTSIFIDGFIYVFIMYLLKSLIDNKYNFIRMFLIYNLSILIYAIITFLFSFYNNLNIIDILLLIKDNLMLNYIFFIVLYLIIYFIYYFKRNITKKHS